MANKITLSELQVLISANATSFQQQLDAVKSQVASIGAVSNNLGSKVNSGLKSAIARYVGLGAAITGAYKAMRAASGYIEDENLFAVSMGKAADETRAWSDQVERSVGVAAPWLRKYTGVMTNMTESMGLSHDTAAKLGKNVALLSQDIASFYNISPEAAFEKMQSAMAGMPRPLQELGIMVRDQELEQTALAMGIRKTNGEFTSAQKALLTYETVIRSTKNAQGDLARTLNTPANQMRMLATNARNLGVAIGTMFQPLLSVALPVLNAIIMAATSAMRALAGLLGIEFPADAGGVGEVAAGVGDIGDAADKAGGKVKKLKGQLASFDEMNTLQEQDPSGGAGGGGGGAGALPTIDWSKYNAGLDNAKNKAIQIAEAIKKAFKDFGKGFDFARIGNAFKRFFNDANKFLTPIGKILGDLWGYFKPFVYWTANDLLPAFLNALGGAINFVGAVIGRVWDSFLKPFIDMFLVPIASFTGGVIVWTLNAIGDGLRWIAENEIAVSVITGLVAGITTYHGIMTIVSAATTAWQFITQTFTAAMIALNAPFIAATASVGMYSVGVAAATSATGFATGAMALLKGALTALGGPIGIISIAIGALVAVFGIFSNKTDENKAKLSEHDQQIDKNKNGVVEYTEKLDYCNEALLALSNAELALFRAEETQRKKMEELTALTKEYSITVDQAKEMIKNNTNAAGLSEAQIRKLKGVVLEAQNADLRVVASQEQVKKAQNETQSAANKLKEEYDQVIKEMEQMSRTGSKTQADFDNLKNKASELATKIKETGRSVGEMKDYQGIAYESGQCLIDGVIRGVNNRAPALKQTFRSLSWDLQTDFRKMHGINSPSRVFAKFGRYIDEGLALGIQKGSGGVLSSMSDLSSAMQGALIPPTLDLPTSLSSLTNQKMHHAFEALDNNRQISVDNHLKIELDGRQLETIITDLQKDRALMLNRDLLGL